MNKRVKLAASISGAVALLGLGIGGAIADGHEAQAATTNGSLGGAGATVVQETGGAEITATSVVVSASPMVKAIPPCGSTQNFTCGMP